MRDNDPYQGFEHQSENNGFDNRDSEDLHQPELSSDRLFEATEAVLLAVDEMLSLRGNCPYPPDLMGTEDQPEALVAFTRFEVAEATAFLVRLGVLRARIRRQPKPGPAESGPAEPEQAD